MNWDDPEARARLIELVGPDRYNAMFEEHRRKSVVATAGGYEIRPVGSRFGRIFMVEGANKGFRTQAEAEAWATANPKAGDIAWDDPRLEKN